jgi:hypothetical protein
MVNIAIIGAGQIGSRHLQALSQLNRITNIQIVDPNYKSLERARERFLQVQENKYVQKVEYLKNIKDLSNNLELVIIATSSDVRREVIEKLLLQKKVRYVILEKVLFQKIKDFAVVNDLLMRNNVKIWVNCPRRMYDFYKKLKSKFKEVKRVDYRVSSSNMGIGCNSIHFLDLFVFLTGQINFVLFSDQLDLNIIMSKRPGFIEFTGTLYGTSSRGSNIAITSYLKGDAPLIISINSEVISCLIREGEGKAWISEKTNNWIWEEISFTTPYQSQLTNLVVQDILDTGNCDLTKYEESWDIHIPLLKSLIFYLQKQKMEEIDLCSIT